MALRLAYGTRSNVTPAIESGTIPNNCIIVTSDTCELFMYDSRNNLINLTNKTVFETEDDVQDWLDVSGDQAIGCLLAIKNEYGTSYTPYVVVAQDHIEVLGSVVVKPTAEDFPEVGIENAVYIATEEGSGDVGGCMYRWCGDQEGYQYIIDPTIASWAKQPNKPTYTPQEIGAENAGSVNAHNTSSTAHDDLRQLIQALETNKQDVLTFDGTPTEGSDNPVTSGGVYDFVNTSVSTATAYFRGTFNSLTELQEYSGEKTVNDYAFVIDTGEHPETKEYQRYKWNGTQWLFEYTLNNSDFTAEQWAAIKSGITSDKVAKITTIEDALSGKSNATNLENGSGQKAIQQPLRATKFDFKENPYLEGGDTGTLDVGAVGEYSFVLGGKGRASGKYAIACTTGSVASGKGAVALGMASYAKGDVSVAEGYLTASKGENSHAEGTSTQALGQASHSEGEGTVAGGRYSHSEGLLTEADGEASHAEGLESVTGKVLTNDNTSGGSTGSGTGGGSDDSFDYDTIITDGTHAEGYKTSAYARGSHSEGTLTVAYNYNSHSEGMSTKAYGNSSHTEGIDTVAGDINNLSSATSAHAEGEGSKALGHRSHAEGNNTIATGNDQHVQGKFNDANSDMAHIVGGGTSETNRKNIHTLDWQGNAYFAGDVEANGQKLSEKADKATTYTKAEVDAKVSSVYRYAGTKTVSMINALDKSKLKTGETYNISDSGTITNPTGYTNIKVEPSDNVAWIKTSDSSPYGYWDKLSSDIDVSVLSGICKIELDMSQIVNIESESYNSQIYYINLTEEQITNMSQRNVTVIDVTLPDGSQGYGTKCSNIVGERFEYGLQFDLRTYYDNYDYYQYIMCYIPNSDEDYNCKIYQQSSLTTDAIRNTFELKMPEYTIQTSSMYLCLGGIYTDPNALMETFTREFTLYLYPPSYDGYEHGNFPYYHINFTTGAIAPTLNIDIREYAPCEYTGQIPTLQPNTTYEIMANWNGSKWVFQYLAY